ncbi:MAG: phosphohydrolase [Magnetococcales bacterium]|nr:phosphohydrolase [Magnetococcales bacterium]
MGESRREGWIQTYTGLRFWPTDARPDEVEIRDVAHALAMLCRFNGHCRRFYSVAEHSVHVSRIVPPEDALWGLLHDASEAYLADLPRPLKRLMPAYREREAALTRVIARRFGLPEAIPATVELADGVLLATEKAALMGPEPAPWEPLPPALDPAMIRAWDPLAAERAFLERFVEITGQAIGEEPSQWKP